MKVHRTRWLIKRWQHQDRIVDKQGRKGYCASLVPEVEEKPNSLTCLVIPFRAKHPVKLLRAACSEPRSERELMRFLREAKEA